MLLELNMTILSGPARIYWLLHLDTCVHYLPNNRTRVGNLRYCRPQGLCPFPLFPSVLLLILGRGKEEKEYKVPQEKSCRQHSLHIFKQQRLKVAVLQLCPVSCSVSLNTGLSIQVPISAFDFREPLSSQ